MNTPEQAQPGATVPDTTGRPPAVVFVVAWLWVLVPFGYGIYQLVLKIPALFGG